MEKVDSVIARTAVEGSAELDDDDVVAGAAQEDVATRPSPADRLLVAICSRHAVLPGGGR